MPKKIQFASQAPLTPALRQLTLRNVSDLKPNARNARIHTKAQIAQLAASILEYGFTNPPLITSDNTVIAGHGRLEAAKLVGMTSIPCIAIDGWSTEQVKAYALADNQLALNASWDPELLSIELQELQNAGYKLDLTGFNVDELARALAVNRPLHHDLDAVPNLEETAVSRMNDLWLLGDHQLLCGDATNPDDVDRLLTSHEVAMCFTDPPYNVDYGGSSNGARKVKKRRILNDSLGSDFSEFLEKACASILRVTNGAVYIFMSSSELATLLRAFTKKGGKWSTFIIWAKNTFTLGRSDYQRQYEPILYGWREGGQHYWSGARDEGDVWHYDKPAGSQAHPTMKPVALAERAILNSSKSGDVVFDPFGGSGTTLIACCRTGRRARLIELDPKYVDVIIRRWERLTGQSAILDGNGQTFAQVKSSRIDQETR